VANSARTLGRRTPRPSPLAPSPGARRAGLVEYFRGVWEELKKVQWPGRDELLRMTGIVIATVILFAVIIGGFDYLLSLGVKQVYTSTPSTNTTTTTTTPARPTLRPTTTLPTAVPSAQAPGNATPVP
jgi:preprotein translocase SecE subunit